MVAARFIAVSPYSPCGVIDGEDGGGRLLIRALAAAACS
jgi:hypothetical protein